MKEELTNLSTTTKAADLQELCFFIAGRHHTVEGKGSSPTFHHYQTHWWHNML